MADDGDEESTGRGLEDKTDEELSEIADDVAESTRSPDLDVDAESAEFWYPTVEDVIAIHDAVIEEDDESEPGIRDPQQVQFPIEYVREGHFGHVPETLHGKAFHLLRLLAANHYFVDGNKRTALNTTELFYLFNGFRFDTGEDIRSLLKLTAVREELIDHDVGVDFFRERSRELTRGDVEELDFDVALLLVLDAFAGAVLEERFHVPPDDRADGEGSSDQKR